MHATERQYHELTHGAGYILCPDRTRIELSGPDRAAFLHNLCTNDIRRLSPGEGCEAFLTSVQGKILADVNVFQGQEALWLDTVPGQGETIAPHLDRYLIREKVEIHDRTGEWSGLLLSGKRSKELLQELGTAVPAGGNFSHTFSHFTDNAIWIAQLDLLGPDCFLLGCSQDTMPAVEERFANAGIVRCDHGMLETLRIEQGHPWYGVDITEKSLPQEVGKDQRAISFTKGCYLGQETVARIDALGHVNWQLVRLKLSDGSPVPDKGEEVQLQGRPMGAITSAVYSPRFQAPVAFARVRSEAADAGATLTTPHGPAVVLAP